MKRLFIITLSFCLVLVSLAQDAVPEDQLYFTVTASRTRVFEQEAVLLTYTFHAYGSMGLSVGMNSKPDFEGLVSQEINQPANKSVYTETVNGRVQRAGVVKQSLVFPQRAGRITVPGLTFNCEVRVGEGILGAAMKLKRRVPDLTLEVEPLPKPAPLAFHGAVGQFEIKSSLNTSNLKTGDIATRLITISGKGNLRLITPPSLRFPEGFDVFDFTVDDNVHVSAEGMQGSVTFNYPFMPRKVGNFSLPSDTLCYFDPQASEYRFVVLPALPLRVTQGQRSAEEMEAEAELRRSDIHPDRETAVSFVPKDWEFWVWLTGVVLLVGVFLIIHKRLLRHEAYHTKMQGVAGADARAEKKLNKAASLFNSKNRVAALSALEETLTDFAKEHVPDAASADLKSMAEALVSKGFDADAVQQWHELLDEIACVRFAPLAEDSDGERALVQRAADVLQRLARKS